MWRWIWLGLISAYMNVYDEFRGYPSEAFREDVYAGFVEFGRRIGVRDMPPSYREFVTLWSSEHNISCCRPGGPIHGRSVDFKHLETS